MNNITITIMNNLYGFNEVILTILFNILSDISYD